MTSKDILYEVRADNGLGGFVVGREAANELVTALGNRPDVLTVIASPLKDCGEYSVPRPCELGCEFVTTDRSAFWHHNCGDPSPTTLAATLEFLGHGEQL